MTPGAPQGGFPSFSSSMNQQYSGLLPRVHPMLLRPGGSTFQLWVFLCRQLGPTDQKQSPKQMYANYRLQGRLTHLLNRSSPQTSPTTLPTPQPPTPGVASRRKELKFHFKEAVPLAMAQPPLPCLPLQHTGPGERSGFQGRVERGGGHQGNAPALSLLWL